MTAKTNPKRAALKTQQHYKLARRRPGSAIRASTIARVSVQLAREDAGLYMTPQEIASKAIELVGAAFAARKAVASGANAKAYYRAARAVVAQFGAELVARGDLRGMVVGVRFHSGRFTSGAENIFYVA